MAESIEQLNIYKLARKLEDEVYELVKTFPADQFYGLGNDLRRSSAAVAHHIMGCHRLYSYRLKLDELGAMRREAEATNEQINLAGDLLGAAKVAELQAGYDSIIKQSWGLTKWLQAKLGERRQKQEAA